MRLTKEQATENRQSIIETAGRLFRASGFHGVSVADLMKAAGFTHGGFYNHFPSKEALAASARQRAVQLLSELVGAIVLARAVAQANLSLSDEILEAVSTGLQTQMKQTTPMNE